MSRDVQELLLKRKVCTRKHGEVVYPMEYSMSHVNFDVWDHMFLVGFCKSLTMHQFDTPPESVLDLGCGGGHWAIEAARKWPKSEIYGLDLTALYPDLSEINPKLYPRVHWQEANFLDGLPYPPQYFDYVRIVGIGLGVPEDEWQYLLEDVCRVMKPGAVIEIVEEDLIFPCPTFPPRPQSSPLTQAHSLRSVVSCSSSSTLCPDTPEERSRTISAIGITDKLYSAFQPNDSKIKVMAQGAASLLSSHSTLFPNPDLPTSSGPKHPQDHTRLKAAWEAMLSRRFIASKLLSVLPFYISSSSFVNIQTHPPFQVPLPPNSGTAPQLKLRHSLESFTPQRRATSNALFDFKPSSSSRSTKADGCSVRSVQPNAQAASPHMATMHLAKTVHTIQACKHSIWEEYAKLYPDDPSPTKRPLPSDQNGSAQYCPRELFDADWGDWENDMTDRIGMRDHLVGISWPETPGERPDCRQWRSKLENNKSSVDGPTIKLTDPQDLCRSIRAFVGWKPKS